jgi:hypothetical protein
MIAEYDPPGCRSMQSIPCVERGGIRVHHPRQVKVINFTNGAGGLIVGIGLAGHTLSRYGPRLNVHSNSQFPRMRASARDPMNATRLVPTAYSVLISCSSSVIPVTFLFFGRQLLLAAPACCYFLFRISHPKTVVEDAHWQKPKLRSLKVVFCKFPRDMHLQAV